ncbi:hypothetical protein PsorP6_014780 [Peronosclerospora sorghi]|uniref:Uncharacterized protein n=1 Tax=Peronosclerospora sorghi TaxID=230839 RepID=A0ACC0VT90_9STRA|nr:hypothetical protein PsorP6_014780 [Peronosclerospora sorghi]
MGGGPATADVVRSSCIVTFPAHTHADPVPIDAWYLYAAGINFVRRLARDRVGDKVPIALLLQEPRGEHGERRYRSVNSNQVLQRALKETFDCPEKAVILHVIDVGNVRGQKRIHVRPEVNPNVSPEPVEPLALVFPTLTVDGSANSSADDVPAAHVTKKTSLYDRMRRSMYNYRKLDGGQECTNKLSAHEPPSLSQSACLVKEREYTKGSRPKTKDERNLAGQGVEDARPSSNGSVQLETKCEDAKPLDAPMVASDLEPIPRDYVMLELQTGAGLPESSTSSTYFLSSRWAEQADEMSASMRLSQGRTHAVPKRRATLDESFVLLERQA